VAATDVRKSILTAIVLALALLVQLTVLNGLRLPGGGVPDLVLVLVASLAMADGPYRGLVTGFIAGLCLDFAPPGSPLVGEYALVFCLVGWAGGKLSGLVTRSALASIALLAAVVALGEALVAGLSVTLDPAQASLTDVRHVLPFSIAYDLVILPLALWLSVRARARAERATAQRERSGVVTAAGPEGGYGRAGKRHQPRELRLDHGSARPHDGWVGSRPGGPAGQAARRPTTRHRLRPANGVAGSAVTGPIRRPVPAAPPANLRLSSRRRRDGSLGNAVGSSLGRHPGLHPGLRTTSSRFRPHGGTPGGSAVQSAALTTSSWRRPVTVSFSSRRGDASVGRILGTSLSSPVLPRSRKVAVPRFRRQTGGVTPGLATRMNASRGADPQSILSARRRAGAAPRLRLANGRRSDAVLGSSVFAKGHSRRDPARPSTPRFHSRPLAGSGSRRASKQPKFGYGRRSVLSFLARRPGGKWLASRRIGRRSGVWLLGRRTGGLR
jgi:rod shape-determining protein MreD